MSRNTLAMGRKGGMHPPNPVSRHFWVTSGVLHTSPCVWERPPVVNNPGNSVAAGKVRLLQRSSGHKTHNGSAARWLCFVGDAPNHAKFCACFCLPNTVVSCETMRRIMRNFALAFACRILLFHVKRHKLRFFDALPTHTKRTEKSVAARERKAF